MKQQTNILIATDFIGSYKENLYRFETQMYSWLLYKESLRNLENYAINHEKYFRDPRVAHHIIHWEHSEHALVQKAAHENDAVHLYELLNGIPLSTAQHYESHANYNQRVVDRLESIRISLVNSGNFTSANAETQIENLINNVIRTAIVNNPNTPLNDIAF